MKTKKVTAAPEVLKAANELGKAAYHAGIKSAPMYDAQLMEMLKGLPIGGPGVSIMDAWSRGWHSQNVQAAW